MHCRCVHRYLLAAAIAPARGYSDPRRCEASDGSSLDRTVAGRLGGGRGVSVVYGHSLVQALPAMLLALLLYGIGVLWIWWKGPKLPPSKDTPK